VLAGSGILFYLSFWLSFLLDHSLCSEVQSLPCRNIEGDTDDIPVDIHMHLVGDSHGLASPGSK